MDKNLSENLNSLAELLPEGLTEHAVDEIAQLVNSVITERVDSEVEGLITKVNAFLRMKVDEIKNYALKELEHNEEFVRNGQIYENMKSMMSVELNKKDTESAISELVNVNEETQENVTILTKEVEKLMEENEKMISVTEALQGKVKLLEKEKAELAEEAENLVESQQLPFESSEKAVMVSNTEEGSVTAERQEVQSVNEFLTPEVMRFMPIAE
jgi:predicted nuclease with TOPRIM domain